MKARKVNSISFTESTFCFFINFKGRIPRSVEIIKSYKRITRDSFHSFYEINPTVHMSKKFKIYF